MLVHTEKLTEKFRFTIQNVPIKYFPVYNINIDIIDLQYKMFLLNR